VPSELRQIFFSALEVLAAIKEHRRRVRKPLPTGTIVRFEIAEKEPLFVVIEITDDETGSRNNYKIGAEALGAALILFCIDHKIPMPVEANKSLRREGGGLCLVVEIANTVRKSPGGR